VECLRGANTLLESPDQISTSARFNQTNPFNVLGKMHFFPFKYGIDGQRRLFVVSVN
jgi:hypothetical protein